MLGRPAYELLAALEALVLGVAKTELVNRREVLGTVDWERAPEKAVNTCSVCSSMTLSSEETSEVAEFF